MGRLTILVTGATGYVGGAVLAHGLARGHRMRALVRRDVGLPGAEVMRGDLFDREALGTACKGADAVIHCAAPLSGNEAEMRRGAVEGTTCLVAAAASAGVARLVLAGSLAVYGARAAGGIVDERTAAETDPAGRDTYMRSRAAQEDAARTATGRMGLWILRLGAVWGPGRLLNGHLGIALGPLLIGPTEGEIPLLHRLHAADALIRAASLAPRGTEVLNLTDNDRPTRGVYVDALRTGGWPRAVLPLPWQAFATLAALPLPARRGLLRPATVRARLMPQRYPNDAARARLGWSPATPFARHMAVAAAAQ